MRPLRPISLRATIILLISGTIVALTLLMLVCVLLVARQAGNQAIARDFRATGALLTQLLADRALSMTEICRAMSSRGNFVSTLLNEKNGGGKEDWATVSLTADDIKKTIHADSVIVTNLHGRKIGQSSVVKPDRSSIQDMPGESQALAGRLWYGLLHEKKQVVVAIAIPIFSPNGQYQRGTFYVTSRLDDTLAGTLRDALDTEIAFINGQRIVASSLTLKELPVLPPVQDDEAALIPEQIRSKGTTYLASYQRLRIANSGERIGILLLHRYDQAMSLSNALSLGLTATALFSLGLAVLLSLLLARRLSQPLDSVVAAARQLREGQWPERLPMHQVEEIALLQSVFNEMTASLREAQNTLLNLIDTDPLTGLDNHRRFQERLGQEVSRSSDSGEQLSLLLMDIDRFHLFNQEHGHAAGDTALSRIAGIIREHQPSVAITARYGGEEFAILLPRTSSEDAQELAETLRTAIAADTRQEITVSIGYAVRGDDTSEADSLTLAAELALVQAKQLGCNRVCGFASVAGTVGLKTADPYHLHHFFRDGSLATIQALAAAVDAKDPYTQGHSRRVAELARYLALQINLPGEKVELVYTAATLHDVGKIGVPDRVLQKKERLNTEEKKLMDTHPVMGEIIVGKVPQLAQTLPGVRSHHERWDGKGYPDGLVGEDIPLIARILALADTYDAMTSDRPYRCGLPIEVSLQEITRNAGTQFDPYLAKQFVLMVEERIAKTRQLTTMR